MAVEVRENYSRQATDCESVLSFKSRRGLFSDSRRRRSSDSHRRRTHGSGLRPTRLYCWNVAALVSSCLLTLAAHGDIHQGGIYRCERPGQPVLYSQFVCPPDRRQARVTPEDHNIVVIPPLSAAETAALKSLERSLHNDRVQDRKAQRRTAQQLVSSRAQAADLCRTARAGLDNIRSRKREGYKAADSRRLERDHERLRAQKKANC